MSDVRTGLLVGVLLILGAMAGYWSAQSLRSPRHSASASNAVVGKPAPELQFKTRSGEIRSLRDFRGKRVLLNFWASWCPPCIEEMPVLDAFARSMRDESLVVIGIAVEEEADARAFLLRHPVDYLIGFGSAAVPDESHRFGNHRNVLPYTVLIDADGIVRRAEARKFVSGEVEVWVAEATE